MYQTDACALLEVQTVQTIQAEWSRILSLQVDLSEFDLEAREQIAGLVNLDNIIQEAALKSRSGISFIYEILRRISAIKYSAMHKTYLADVGKVGMSTLSGKLVILTEGRTPSAIRRELTVRNHLKLMYLQVRICTTCCLGVGQHNIFKFGCSVLIDPMWGSIAHRFGPHAYAMNRLASTLARRRDLDGAEEGMASSSDLKLMKEQYAHTLFCIVTNVAGVEVAVMIAREIERLNSLLRK